jgi:UDP-glucose:(heptosyl)LPS alpha-1,3-glucosyltransferase
MGSRRAAIEQNLALLPPVVRGAKRAVSRWLPRHRQFDALLARQYVDDGRIVVAVSQRVAADVQRYHGVRPEQIRVVYNGVDIDRFSPEHRRRYRGPLRRLLGVGPEALLLLIVAHNYRLKGVPVLLSALARLEAGRPVHLVVVGGKRPARWTARAARQGIADRVHFVGPVDDVVPFYGAADVYVQPTFYDPCSLVALEALASGLPVVTSRVNGVSELMADGVEGRLLDDPTEVDALLDALTSLLDPTVRERTGQSARQLALRQTFRRNVDRVLAVYDEFRPRRRRAA